MKKLAFFVLFFAFNSFGWSDLTVSYMIVNTYKTLPEGMKLYLDNNRKEILKGAESLKEENFSSPAEVQKFICSQKKKIEKMIKDRKKVKHIAFELGKLFKAIAILSYPFSFEDSFYSKDYENYTAYKLKKFVFAFKRIKKENLKANGCEILVKSLYRESRSLREKIMNDYSIYESSSNFDDLSAAFGSGSLLFSDTCFAMSAVAAEIWVNVNGKLKGCLIVERKTK